MCRYSKHSSGMLTFDRFNPPVHPLAVGDGAIVSAGDARFGGDGGKPPGTVDLVSSTRGSLKSPTLRCFMSYVLENARPCLIL